jgi:hypothetical protein
MLKWILTKSAAAALICGSIVTGCAGAQHPAANPASTADSRVAPAPAGNAGAGASANRSSNSPAVPAAAQISTARNAVAAIAKETGGPGGGWIIGARRQNLRAGHDALASKANQNAEQHPAAPGDVAASTDADLNHDGFVTLDEIIALKRAGLTEEQMKDRITHADQLFAPNERQQQYLRDRGISQPVIDAMLHTGQ